MKNKSVMASVRARNAWIDVVFSSVSLVLIMIYLLQTAIIYNNLGVVPVQYNIWTGKVIMSPRIEDFAFFAICTLITLTIFAVILTQSMTELHDIVKENKTEKQRI